MDFTHPTQEPKPWPEMDDAERRAYFRQCAANEPVDRSAFREALAQLRAPEQQAERDSGKVEAEQRHGKECRRQRSKC